MNTDQQIDQSTAFTLGAVEVYPDTLRLIVNGEEVRVEPKVMDLLVYGSERCGQLLSKEVIMADVWSGVQVVPAALQRVVSLLRKALGDSRDQPVFLETVSKKGYRFLVQPKGLLGDNTIQLNEKTIRTSPLILIVAALLIAAITWVAVDRFRPTDAVAPEAENGPQTETAEHAPPPLPDD